MRPLTLTVVDLFCGAGGLSLGFHAAGCRVLAGADVDLAAARTFERNFKVLQQDAPPRVYPGIQLESAGTEAIDIGGKSGPGILVGGPPCQGFSRIGRAKLTSLRGGDAMPDQRNDLFRTFIRFARKWQPLAVLMENVPDMLSLQGQNHADDAAAVLEECGYRVGHAVLNAVWYGVPQFRERLFLLGVRRDLGVEPAMPPATHRAAVPSGYVHSRTEWEPQLPFIRSYRLPVPLAPQRLAATTVAQAVDDLPSITHHLESVQLRPRGMDPRPLQYRSEPHSTYAALMRSWPGLPRRDHVQDHVVRRTPRDHETFRRMLPGDRYPEAYDIARRRFEEELDGMLPGTEPAVGTTEYKLLQRKFIPPYPVDIFPDKWRKLISDQPSWTVPAHLSRDAYSHIHHDSRQARAISIREAARLQSFPDGFAFSGNMGDCFRQIGNAVPPLLAWVIAREVMELLGFEAQAPSWSDTPHHAGRSSTER